MRIEGANSTPLIQLLRVGSASPIFFANQYPPGSSLGQAFWITH
jgi:hypothetical protein